MTPSTKQSQPTCPSYFRENPEGGVFILTYKNNAKVSNGSIKLIQRSYVMPHTVTLKSSNGQLIYARNTLIPLSNNIINNNYHR